MLPALIAIRVLVDGLIAQLEAAGAPPAPAPGECPHPADRQVDGSTLGQPNGGARRPGRHPRASDVSDRGTGRVGWCAEPVVRTRTL